MIRKTRWAWGLIVYVLVAVLLLGGVIYSAYLTIFQLAPALVTLSPNPSPNLEIAGKVASGLSIANPIFTILILLFAIHDKRTKRTTQISEWQQKHFEELKDQIPTFMSPSYLRDCKLQIEIALMGANSGAAFAEIWKPKTTTKQGIADLISNGMKDYRLELPVRVKRVIVALAEITTEVDSEQADLFRRTVCGITPVELCGWILADALRKQDFLLLEAAHNLGIDTVALNSLSVPHMNKRFEFLPQAIPHLL